jgi:hypothetical protein
MMKVAQSYTYGKGFTPLFYPMPTESETHHSLTNFIQVGGIPPEWLISDNAKAQMSKAWNDKMREHRIKHTTTAQYSPWQNRAEQEVKEVKHGIKRHTKRQQSPKQLWCYLGQYCLALRRFTASDNTIERGHSPFERVLGYTPDISMYLLFDWCGSVYYLDRDGETNIGSGFLRAAFLVFASSNKSGFHSFSR